MRKLKRPEKSASMRAGLEVTQLHVKIDSMSEQLMQRLTALEKQVGQRPPNAAA